MPAFARRLLRPAWERRHWERVWSGAETPYWLVDEARPAVIAAARDGWLPRGGTVLEIGCGLGDNAAWLAGEGWTVLATDIAPSAVARARKRHRDVPRLEFGVLDACAPDALGRKFTAIVDSGCLHIIPAALRGRYRENLLAWSAPGTRYFLRVGDDVFEPRAAEALARSLFEPAFELENVAIFPRTSRPGEQKRSIAFRMIRRG